MYPARAILQHVIKAWYCFFLHYRLKVTGLANETNQIINTLEFSHVSLFHCHGTTDSFFRNKVPYFRMELLFMTNIEELLVSQEELCKERMTKRTKQEQNSCYSHVLHKYKR